MLWTTDTNGVVLEREDTYVRDNAKVILRNGQEIQFCADLKNAGAFCLHTYGLRMTDAKSVGIEVKGIANRKPQPGDAFVYCGPNYCQRDPDHELKFKQEYGILNMTCGSLSGCFHPSAYREGSHVSCSGGPLPWMPVDSLTFVGLREMRFWRWHDDSAGASQGGDYWMTVPLWRWNGISKIEG